MTSFPLFTLFLSFFSEMCVKLLFPFIFLFPSRHFALATGWIGYFNCSIPFPTRIFRTPGVVGADPKAEAEAETERHKRSCKQKQAEEERWVVYVCYRTWYDIMVFDFVGWVAAGNGNTKSEGIFYLRLLCEKRKKEETKPQNGQRRGFFCILYSPGTDQYRYPCNFMRFVYYILT